MSVFKGPLGSHTNFISYIALDNCSDYTRLCGLNRENGKDKTPDRFKEMRYFLNTIESFNNILDYFYYEFEDEISYENLKKFKQAVWRKYPILKKVAEIANAYKHCVREHKQVKQIGQLWAKDLQNPQIDVSINLTEITTSVGFNFPWPIKEHEDVLDEAFKFWINYIHKENTIDFKKI
ncbi:hypothetical protein [Shewanella sp. KJ2020]|uniref:hypothetical protein n=1 Tax=Shewanella sp. KJ2020 TaxID=2919172 RepID=UPI0020A72828|nr:hypothetical protein [Shewanella sp. KJ2020]MCP3128546.1 hypothetical protein [Shewanella sp. KJ2020]